MRNKDLSQGGYRLLGETLSTALRKKEKKCEPCRTNGAIIPKNREKSEKLDG